MSLEKLGQQIVQAVASGIRPEAGTNPSPSPMFDPTQTLKAVAAHIGYKVPAATLKLLREKSAKVDAATQRITQLSTASARGLQEAQAKRAAELLEAGNLEAGAGMPQDWRGKKQLAQNLKAQKHALKEAMRAVIVEAANIARPVSEEFRQQANTWVDEIEADEKEAAESLCLGYQPSPMVLTLRRVLNEMLPSYIPQPAVVAYQNPRQFLPFADL